MNYPPVWNIWKFDWVQYNASVSQPMARNIGESMGTGAKYALLDRYGNPLPPDQRFRSSANVENLHTIELTLRKLQPPAWQEDVLGPIDRAKAARGKELFNKHCVAATGRTSRRPRSRRSNVAAQDRQRARMDRQDGSALDDIGTDPNSALNFANANADMDITRTGLTADDLRNVARQALEPARASATHAPI